MPSLSRLITFLLFLIMMTYACNSVPENKLVQQIADSAIRHVNAENLPVNKKDSMVLKNVVLDEKVVIGKRTLARAKLLEADQLVNLSINTVDAAADKKGFKYHLVDTLFKGTAIKVFLIGREFAEENIIWLALYGKDNNLLDSKELYYDNAEGFKNISTVIKNDIISVSINNDYAETDAEQKMKLQYFVDDKGKILKKK